MSKKKEKKATGYDKRFAKRDAKRVRYVRRHLRAHEKALAKVESESRSIFEHQGGSTLEVREEDRREVVRMLEEEIAVPLGKNKAMRAIFEAARALAPIFSVTSVKDESAHFSEDSESHPLHNPAIVVEIFLSAGAYLARSRGMKKEELLEKFEGWMRDNGYE